MTKIGGRTGELMTMVHELSTRTGVDWDGWPIPPTAAPLLAANSWEQEQLPTVAAVIPTIPPRRFSLLSHALASVWKQTYPISQVSIAVDTARHGAAVTRYRALLAVNNNIDWVAFLDDDDEWYPNHVAALLACAIRTDADYVFSHYDLNRTPNVFATPEEPEGHWGKPFNNDHPHHTTMTVLVKTGLAKHVGFSKRPEGDEAGGEDWRFTLGCVEAGAKIVHLPELTWFWRHHPLNTSGREDRWWPSG